MECPKKPRNMWWHLSTLTHHLFWGSEVLNPLQSGPECSLGDLGLLHETIPEDEIFDKAIHSMLLQLQQVLDTKWLVRIMRVSRRDSARKWDCLLERERQRSDNTKADLLVKYTNMDICLPLLIWLLTTLFYPLHAYVHTSIKMWKFSIIHARSRDAIDNETLTACATCWFSYITTVLPKFPTLWKREAK